MRTSYLCVLSETTLSKNNNVFQILGSSNIYVLRINLLCNVPVDGSFTEITGTPSPYHLLDHEYGITPKDQMIKRPLLSPVKTQVCVRNQFLILCLRAEVLFDYSIIFLLISIFFFSTPECQTASESRSSIERRCRISCAQETTSWKIFFAEKYVTLYPDWVKLVVKCSFVYLIS